MTCSEARDAFSDLYDGLLSGPSLAALSRHLDECPACQAEWAAFRQSLRALSDLGSEEPPPGFAVRVAAEIERPAWWRRLLPSVVLPLPRRLPLHAGALALLLVAGWWLVREIPEMERGVELRRPQSAATPAPSPPVPEPRRDAPVPLAVPPPAKVGVAPRLKAEASSPAPPSASPAPPGPSPAEKAERSLSTSQAVIPPPPPAGGERLAPERREPATPSGAGATPKEVRTVEPLRAETDAKLKDAASPPRQELVRATAPPARLGAAQAPAMGAGESADDRFSAAATAFASRDYAGAVDGFRAFLAEQPHDRRAADARFFLAEALFALGRHAEAAPLYAEFLAERPDHRQAVVATYRQGLSRLALGDPAGCPLLRSALERAPRAADAAAAKAALTRCP